MKKRLLAAFMMVCVLATSVGIEAAAAGKTTTDAKVQVETVKETVSQRGKVNFAYLENGKVELSEEQKIMISVGENGSTVKNARLYYHRAEDGAAFWTEEEAISENAVLFSVKYSEKAQKGIYVLDKIVYETKVGQKYEADLAEEKEMKFGF